MATTILAIKNQNGKRERIPTEEDSEFMPLSKRINNLHLTPESEKLAQQSVFNNHQMPGLNSVSVVKNLFGHCPTQENHRSHCEQSSGSVLPALDNVQLHHNHIADPHLHFPDNSHNTQAQQPVSYSPSLDASSNPYYYEQNRQLFHLYLERIHRHQLPMHPNLYPHNN